MPDNGIIVRQNGVATGAEGLPPPYWTSKMQSEQLKIQGKIAIFIT
jgi:hypothetical protein